MIRRAPPRLEVFEGVPGRTEGSPVSIWITVSRAVVGVIGAGALVLAGGNLLTGGGSITDPVMPGGVGLGLVAVGAAAWTMSPGIVRAAVVWLGVLGIGVTLAILWVNVGDMQTRDLLIYVGIPTVLVLLATLGVAVGRARAGALGA
jgi:hypothetical protein